jgi:hypothetical protein
LGFEEEVERFILSELPIQNPLKKSGSNFLRQTKTKYSSAEEYLPKAFHFSKWKAFFFSSETGSLSVAEAPGLRSEKEKPLLNHSSKGL